MENQFSLRGKKILITGASQGFGFELAKYFSKNGADILITGRNEESLNKANHEISKISNGNVFVKVCDISSKSDNEDTFNFAIKVLNRIDVLVANAGVYGPKGEIEKIDWESWSKAIDINLKGTVLSCISVVNHMKNNNYGKIIIMSGGGATKPMPLISSYAASKAAVVRFAETLSLELKKYNIDVNTVAPGAMNTRLLDEILDAGPKLVGEEFYNKALQQKKSGGTDMIHAIRLCEYLSTSNSDGITGRLISAIWDPWKKFNLYKKNLIIQTFIHFVELFQKKEMKIGKIYKVIIIGCGLIGQKRAESLESATLVGCCDINENTAREFSFKNGNIPFFTNYEKLIDQVNFDLAIISATHNALPDLIKKTLNVNKHVLVEKPAGIFFKDLEILQEMAKKIIVLSILDLTIDITGL